MKTEKDESQLFRDSPWRESSELVPHKQHARATPKRVPIRLRFPPHFFSGNKSHCFIGQTRSNAISIPVAPDVHDGLGQIQPSGLGDGWWAGVRRVRLRINTFLRVIYDIFFFSSHDVSSRGSLCDAEII